MPKGVMVVQTGCEPGREDEYNDWYSNTHIPEVLAVPGFVGARRFKVHQPGRRTGHPRATRTCRSTRSRPTT